MLPSGTSEELSIVHTASSLHCSKDEGGNLAQNVIVKWNGIFVNIR